MKPSQNEPKASGTFPSFLLGFTPFVAFPLMYYAWLLGDSSSRPIAQVVWLGIFVTYASYVLFMRDYGGPEWLSTTFFWVKILLILLTILQGTWWFRHSSEIGCPVLFANALWSFAWTYPCIDFFFYAVVQRIEKREGSTFAVIVAILCVWPVLWFIDDVLDNYVHKTESIADMKEMRRIGLIRYWNLGDGLATSRPTKLETEFVFDSVERQHVYNRLRREGFSPDEAKRTSGLLQEMDERDERIREGTYRKR